MSKIRECFKSRREFGHLIEADYSQLEINVLALLSEDAMLIKDLKSGRDLHTMRASELYNIKEYDVTPKQRRLAKTLSFQLQYGAGAKTMADINKIPQKLAKDFIFNFFDRYEDVWRWHGDLQAHVSNTRQHNGERTPMGLPRYQSEMTTKTGRTLVFKEYDSKYKKGETSFSPTEIKNYPVQSVATDIMKISLGALAYKVWFDEDICIINTVHDNIMLDVSEENHTRACKLLTWAMLDRTTEILKKRYNIELPVPLEIEIKSGGSWDCMKKVDLPFMQYKGVDIRNI